MDFEDKKDYFSIALFLGLSALLIWVSWSSLPYEQDQMSKAAKVMNMSQNGTYLNPISGISGYRDTLFSLFYILNSLFYYLSDVNVFLSGNIFSAILGIFSSFVLVYFVNKNFPSDKWISFFVLLNVPIFVITFSYSNEASLSFALFISSIAIIEYKSKYNSLFSGILFGAACFSRPDVSLLIPFWLLWQYIKYDRYRFYNILKSTLSLGLFGLGYSFYVLGGIPLDVSTGFKWGGNLKLTAAIMSYPFGLPILVISLYGAYIILVRKKLKKGYALLLTFLPFLFYVSNLSSPKYVFYLVVPVVVAASTGLKNMSTPLRYGSIALILSFWFVSFSPFGVKLAEKGSRWYLPTADGAIPTGSYAYFYSKPTSKSHIAKYLHELNDAENIVDYAEKKTNKFTLAGGINGHALKYAAVKNGYEGEIPGMERTLQVPKDKNNLIMARRSYLWGLRMSKELANKFINWLENGRVKPINCKECIFPPLIKVGSGVEKGKRISLGKRILYTNYYYKGYSVIKSESFLPEYRSLSWIKNNTKPDNKCKPSFSDINVLAFRCKIKSRIKTRMNMPYVYTKFKNPKKVKKGYNDVFSSR